MHQYCQTESGFTKDNVTAVDDLLYYLDNQQQIYTIRRRVDYFSIAVLVGRIQGNARSKT